MDAAIQKKNYSFRFSVDLMEKLKILAKRQNRSVNNYLETMILDEVYHTPNAETIAAIEEARSGKLRNVPSLDLSSIDALERSMGL